MSIREVKLDEETERSYSRQAYGHEMWLDSVGKEDGMFYVYGLYGHKMLPDKPMPTDYANPLVYDDNGRAPNPEREIVRKPSGWKFTFEDKGAEVYTFYIDSNSVWVTNDEGWHRGGKRDYSKVNFSSAYNMVAKRIISRDGKNPGSVMHAALEVMPETATLKVGSDATMGIFYEGKPLANAKCIIFNRGWQDLLMTKSGADGKVTFKVDQPGDYIVIAKYTDTTKSVSDEFDETSFTTALTIGAE